MSVTSEYENGVVQGLLNGVADPENGWVGGSDAAEEGKWKWVDGEDFTFTNWWTGEKIDWSLN